MSLEHWTQVAYAYDGTFAGFLTCVEESFRHFEEPAAFTRPGEEQLSLYPLRTIETDRPRATRFYRRLKEEGSEEVQRMTAHGFLTCMEERERALWQFLELYHQLGPGVVYWYADPRVDRVRKGILHLHNEAHLLKGFVRFSDHQGVLWGEISPKNRVLPLLRPHFCQRFGAETFLLYDRTHQEGLISQQGKGRLIPIDRMEFPAPDAQEEAYRALWRRFYDTIAIEGRYNPNLRRSNVPKRYWQHMTELQGELRGAPPRKRELRGPAPPASNGALGPGEGRS